MIHTALPIKKDCVLVSSMEALVCVLCGRVACGRGKAGACVFRCCCVALGGKKFDHPWVIASGLLSHCQSRWSAYLLHCAMIAATLCVARAVRAVRWVRRRALVSGRGLR